MNAEQCPVAAILYTKPVYLSLWFGSVGSYDVYIHHCRLLLTTLLPHCTGAVACEQHSSNCEVLITSELTLQAELNGYR